VLGIIITVATAFQQYGIEQTEAGKAAFITALYVVFVPIISSLFGKKPSVTALISIPIAVAGFYLMCINVGEVFAAADLLVLICALIFALHIISVDRLSVNCDGVRMSCVQFATALVLNTAISLIIGESYTVLDFTLALPSLLFLGILSSGVAYTLQIIGQKEADPTVSSMILSLESVFGVIGGAILLSERMSAREYIGCGVVFLAVFLAQIEPATIARLIERFRK
jgi:drug/metabolite transporter (DMT)-like permease